MVAVAVLLLVLATLFGGVMTASVLADENYEDNSQEFSDGPGSSG